MGKLEEKTAFMQLGPRVRCTEIVFVIEPDAAWKL